MQPTIICHMTSSIDGGLHPSRYSPSDQGDAKDWSAVYEDIHKAIGASAWLVGRATMAEMSKAEAHPPETIDEIERPIHVARKADRYAVTIDRHARLHFDGDAVGGDHAIVILAADVSDVHLAELAGDGVSYIVADTDPIDLRSAMAALRTNFAIETLLLEGGGTINAAFLDAGLVDELSVVVTPTLDGARDAERIVMHDGKLGDAVRLSLVSATPRDHGAVWLRYRVEHGG